ncbi:MAG: hypothetical protein DRJ98_03655 [Thermoprotei archaeon]|nr:MAG: hypothetical protein DRJ98_03655 [Thermoprotei archaeon]
MSEELKRELSSCTDCRMCDNVCPFYLATGDESIGAWNRVKVAQAVLGGDRRVSDVLRELYLCTCCGTCELACPVNVPISEAVRALRSLAVKERCAPEPIVKLCEGIINQGSMTGEGKEFWRSWIPTEVNFPSEAEYLYLVGCMIPFRLRDIGRATVDILKTAGVDFTILGEDERCCGLLLVDHGLLEEAKTVAERNLSRIEGRKPSVVLMACAACYYTYKHVYQRIYRKPEFEVMHVAEALADLIDHGRISFKKRIDEKVAFLDPCHFVKVSGKYEIPRKVIENIPGLKLIEFPRSRAEALCCGAPGGVRLVSRDVAFSAAGMIVKEALKLEVSRIVTSCPLCMYQLSWAAEKLGTGRLKVSDLPLLVKEAL